MNVMWHWEITVFILTFPMDIKSQLTVEIERPKMKGLPDVDCLHATMPQLNQSDIHFRRNMGNTLGMIITTSKPFCIQTPYDRSSDPTKDQSTIQSTVDLPTGMASITELYSRSRCFLTCSVLAWKGGETVSITCAVQVIEGHSSAVWWALSLWWHKAIPIVQTHFRLS